MSEQTQAQAAVPQTKATMKFDVLQVTGNSIVVHYDVINGSAPAKMSNYLFSWQTNGDEVPIGKKANDSIGIQSDDPDNTQPLPADVGSEGYLVGYAVGPCKASGNLFENVAATQQVPQGTTDAGKLAPAVVADVTITLAKDDVISIHFALPPGSQPATQGDWAAVFETGDSSALFTLAPISGTAQAVPGNESSNDLDFSLQMQRGYAYTVGYFKGGWDVKTPVQTTLAAASTYQN